MCSRRSRHRNRITIRRDLLQHDVGNLDGRVVGILKRISGSNRAGNIGDLNPDGGVLVTPLDADWVLNCEIASPIKVTLEIPLVACGSDTTLVVLQDVLTTCRRCFRRAGWQVSRRGRSLNMCRGCRRKAIKLLLVSFIAIFAYFE